MKRLRKVVFLVVHASATDLKFCDRTIKFDYVQLIFSVRVIPQSAGNLVTSGIQSCCK